MVSPVVWFSASAVMCWVTPGWLAVACCSRIPVVVETSSPVKKTLPLSAKVMVQIWPATSVWISNSSPTTNDPPGPSSSCLDFSVNGVPRLPKPSCS
jgi:hypothetical protein